MSILKFELKEFMPDSFKQCSRCREFKPLTNEFFGLTSNRHGNSYTHAMCQVCRSQAQQPLINARVKRRKAMTLEELRAEVLTFYPDGTKKCSQCKVVRSCDMYPLDRRAPTGIDCKCRACGAYKKARETTKERGFNLEELVSKDEFFKVYFSPCMYCPETCTESAHGVDRIDSDKGYVIGNMQPSCIQHNVMKLSMDHKVFVKYCSSVYQRYGKKKSNGKKVKQEQTLFPL